PQQHNRRKPSVERCHCQSDLASLNGYSYGDDATVDIVSADQIVDAADHIRVSALVVSAVRTREAPGELVGSVDFPEIGGGTLGSRIHLQNGVTALALVKHDALLKSAITGGSDDRAPRTGLFSGADRER